MHSFLSQVCLCIYNIPYIYSISAWAFTKLSDAQKQQGSSPLKTYIICKKNNNNLSNDLASREKPKKLTSELSPIFFVYIALCFFYLLEGLKCQPGLTEQIFYFKSKSKKFQFTNGYWWNAYLWWRPFWYRNAKFYRNPFNSFIKIWVWRTWHSYLVLMLGGISSRWKWHFNG